MDYSLKQHEYVEALFDYNSSGLKVNCFFPSFLQCFSLLLLVSYTQYNLFNIKHHIEIAISIFDKVDVVWGYRSFIQKTRSPKSSRSFPRNQVLDKVIIKSTFLSRCRLGQISYLDILLKKIFSIIGKPLQSGITWANWSCTNQLRNRSISPYSKGISIPSICISLLILSSSLY